MRSPCVRIGTHRAGLQTEPKPFHDEPAPKINSKMYLYFHKEGVACYCLPIYSGILGIRTVRYLEDSGILLSLPVPSPPHKHPHTPSFVSLSCLAVIDRLLNYEKVERALVKHRGIFIAVCGPPPPSYISE